MVNITRLFKIAVITLTAIILITFILPYTPESLATTGIIQQEDVSFQTEDRPDVQVQNHDEIAKNSELLPARQEDNNPKLQNGKMFIILVTGFRTGSTFLGELFNQNSDVLYLFEPFHQNHIRNLVEQNEIHDVTAANSLLEQRTNYLEQILSNCDIANAKFGGMSKGMKCGTPEENLKRFDSTTCDTGNGKWNRACKRKDMVALKLIRLQRIQHLDLVPGIKDANVKVIHLIRDPRGTMNSRLAFGTFYLDDIKNIPIRPLTPEKMGIAAANLCDREWENVQFSENLPDWLRGNYFRITHDEMSLEPIDSAKRVYKFIGKPIPPDMESFLIEHTTTQQKGILNTSKNSTAVLQKWKEKLNPDIIRAIEDKCKNLMDYMGYKPYQELGV